MIVVVFCLLTKNARIKMGAWSPINLYLGKNQSKPEHGIKWEETWVLGIPTQPCMLGPFKTLNACLLGQFHGQRRINENPLEDLDISVSLRAKKIRVFTRSDYFTHSLTLTLLSSQQCATWNQLVFLFSVPSVALLYIFVDLRAYML